MRGRLTALLLLSIAAIVLLASCSREESPLAVSAGQPTDDTTFDPVITSAPGVTINNYIVHFDGRTYAADQTTFTYTVTGTGTEPALSHFTIELPDCAPELVAYSPTNSVSINHNPQTDIYGIEWHLSVAAEDTVGRLYSITFAGDVPEGVVYSAVKSGNETEVGRIPGPCAGFTIAGTVYVDADRDGLRDSTEESGIADVIVELVADDGAVATAVSDADGGYLFIVPDGIYTVRIDLAAYPNAFNADLATSFDATSPTSREVTVGPDALNNDFGFAPRAEEIVVELETGILVSNGEPIKFWKKQLRTALNGGNGSSVHDAASLLAFIAEIETLFLASPYQFTAGNELQEAYDILRSNSKDDLDVLYRELLATEFNEVSGRGLIGDEALQDVLISWGEALLAENQAGAGAGAGPSDDIRVSVTSQNDVAIAGDIFGLLNTGGGGGADE